MKKRCLQLLIGCVVLCQDVFAYEWQYAENQFSDNGYFVYGEFLYLQPFVDGLEYGLTLVNTPNLTVPVGNIDAKVNNVDFEWSPGFRVGAGYLSPTYWDLTAEWTNFYGKAHGSFQTSNFPEEYLSAQWISDGVGGQADSAHAKWSMNFNTFDLSIGKEFSICNCFYLRPFIGARAAWIDQHYNVFYHSQFAYSIFSVGGGVLPFDTDVKIKQDFTAGGLRGGSDFIWNFAPEWSLYGNFSASMLYAHYNYKLSLLGGSLVQELLHLPSPSVVPTVAKLTDRYNRVRSNFEESIGLQWSKCFGQCHVLFRLGYEFSQWLDQNDFINVISSVNSESFSFDGKSVNDISSDNLIHKGRSLFLQGLTARVEFSF